MSGIPVTGVSELVLEVVDLAAAERLYAGVLGLPVVGALASARGDHGRAVREPSPRALPRLRALGAP